jgi:hypothetical protein
LGWANTYAWGEGRRRAAVATETLIFVTPLKHWLGHFTWITVYPR